MTKHKQLARRERSMVYLSENPSTIEGKRLVENEKERYLAHIKRHGKGGKPFVPRIDIHNGLPNKQIVDMDRICGLPQRIPPSRKRRKLVNDKWSQALLSPANPCDDQRSLEQNQVNDKVPGKSIEDRILINQASKDQDNNNKQASRPNNVDK